MDPDSHAFPLVEDKESRDDLKVSQQKFSSTSSVSELVTKASCLISSNPFA